MSFDFKRGTALTLSTALMVGISAAAAPATTTTRVERPGITRHPAATASGTEQVLGEGGTLAAYVYGNIADVYGELLQGPATGNKGRDQQSTAEVELPAKSKTNPQYNYAPTGSGTASFDFVNQKSGAKGKNISQLYPWTVDGTDNWAGESIVNGVPTLATSGPYGFAPWASTASSSVASDSLHFAAGDAPLPLGDPADSSYDNSIDYANSLAAYNNGGTPPAIGEGNPGGYNPSRGPAVVVPLVGTGVSVIFNTTGLTLNSQGTLNLTQADVCGIFTGTITNWNQTSANPGNQAITIVHRSDGSGTTFLMSYDLLEMCSAHNPKGYVTSANYWGVQGSTGRTQGVGTDSNNFKDSANTMIPMDTGAPEVVWPNSSLGASGNGGVAACVQTGTPSSSVCTVPTGGGSTPNGTGAGYVGYVSPSYTIGLVNAAEANVENYTGAFEPATSATVSASLNGTGSAGTAPPAYPTNEGLYFPFPLAPTGAPIVGFTYGYFYQCSNARLKDQVTEIADLFKYLETADKNGAATPADDIVTAWELTPLPAAIKKTTTTALGGLKAAAVTKGTYIDPVNGAKDTYSCTPV
jgi:ABC-type phosphate transport system substrate-binding protein